MFRKIRLLNMENFEFYQISDNDYTNYGYLLIADTKRKSKLSDFPLIADIETEEDFESSSNHIKIILFELPDMNDDCLEDVFSFTNDLFNLKPDTSYYMEQYKITESLDFDFPEDMLAINRYVNKLLQEAKIDIKIPDVTEESFNNLLQK